MAGDKQEIVKRSYESGKGEKRAINWIICVTIDALRGWFELLATSMAQLIYFPT
jgi:hypothetical protein